MYCLSQAKNGLSALALGRLLGVNNNSAWLLKHKLMQAMLERDQSYRLEGRVQVDDAYLGGELPGGKRGRGSQNKTPFLAAVQVTAEGQPVCLKLSVLEGFSKAEVERWAHQHLAPGSTVVSDGLACFGGVQAADCQHRPLVTGGGKAACELPELLWVNTILGNVKRSLDGTYHAFQPKYAARYLAEFQYNSESRVIPSRFRKAGGARAERGIGLGIITGCLGTPAPRHWVGTGAAASPQERSWPWLLVSAGDRRAGRPRSIRRIRDRATER